jgi:putative transposase
LDQPAVGAGLCRGGSGRDQRKVRDGQVANRPLYAAIGVDPESHKDNLGMWFGDGGGESAKFWMVVLTERRNRGVADVFFLVCDGLKGLPDTVNAVWPATIVQTCLIHLIRNSFRFASRKYWDQLSRDLKPIYQALNAEAAAAALDDLHAKWGTRYPAIIRLWRNAWAGSPDVLPHRGPLSTGRASYPCIRLKQAHWGRGMVRSGRCAARPCGRSGCGPGVKREDRSSVRVAGRR